MWIFERPAYLLLLTVVVPAIYFTHFFRGRGGVIPFSIGLWKSSRFKPSNHFLRFVAFISNTAFWSGVVLLLLAMAGPAYQVTGFECMRTELGPPDDTGRRRPVPGLRHVSGPPS